MRYRIKSKEIRESKTERGLCKRASANSPKRLFGYRYDEIDLSALFEEKKKRSKARIGAFEALKSRFLTAVAAFRKRAFRIIEKRRKRREKRWVIPTLAGALAGILVVCGVSAFAALYKVVISDYFGRYEEVAVPVLVGKSYDVARDKIDEKYFNVMVSFEYSGSVPRGEVISQSPIGGVKRKIYRGGSLPTLSFVVSRGKESFVMSDFVGRRARDAELELKNMGATVTIVENYSDEAAGTVISSIPSADESFYIDDVVTLKVSLGKKRYFASVPSLIGQSESRAISLISSSGLKLGSVSYRTSSIPKGTVISQSVEPYSSAEYGTRISLEVSAGREVRERTMPSLYGMTLEEAKDKISSLGLVLGDIYAVESSEPKGSIVSQSPAADSDISREIKVDLYVSA